MVLNITSRNIEITPDVRNFINEKIQKVLKNFKKPIDCNIIITKERSNIITEIIIHGDGKKLYFKKSANNLTASIEQAIHTADSSIKKVKSKQKEHKAKGIKKFLFGKI